METHVFAVWDFMTLLKRLQRDITCIELPWRPSSYSKNLVRLINEIVLGEESDIDIDGNAIDHFSLYIKAMDEIKASPKRLMNLVSDGDYKKWCYPAEENFVRFNIDLAKNGELHQVAAAFFFGREKIIPDMFASILKDLTDSFADESEITFPSLRYYLMRHIELDGSDHSYKAYECLKSICGDDSKKWEEAKEAGIKSLMLRSALWSDLEKRLNL